jgi:DMSO/TMAO reductase YedYZ heme-binding membrane subunit
VIAILFLLLLAISSDRAVRWLGPQRWKKLQGSAQLVMWLTVIHGIAYQLLEARYIPLLVLLLVSATVLTIRSRAAVRQVHSALRN